MEIITTARRMKLTPELKEQVEKRIQKLNRYSDQILEAHLVLSEEKYRHIAELTLRAAGTDLVSREETTEMVTSIDRVVDRMERQIKKLNARIKDRKSLRAVPAMSLVEEVELPDVEVEDEFSPVVVRSRQVSKESMTVEEAIRFMRERDWDLLLFSNTKTGHPCMVHLRPDGNFGLVEME